MFHDVHLCLRIGDPLAGKLITSDWRPDHCPDCGTWIWTTQPGRDSGLPMVCLACAAPVAIRHVRGEC